jgi:hypothetical protein
MRNPARRCFRFSFIPELRRARRGGAKAPGEEEQREDTIPKPVGLGSGDPQNGLAVQLSSSICPASVQVLSSFFLASVRAISIQIRNLACHGRQVSAHSE